jgi:hypothetical protein
MGHTGDIIAFVVVSLGCALLGWGAVHVAAKFERERAIHLLEKYGPNLNAADSPRQWRWVSLIRAAFNTENESRPNF